MRQVSALNRLKELLELFTPVVVCGQSGSQAKGARGSCAESSEASAFWTKPFRAVNSSKQTSRRSCEASTAMPCLSDHSLNRAAAGWTTPNLYR